MQSVFSSVTCIIPFYNEDTRVLSKIVNKLSAIESISKIILVDDGSYSREAFEYFEKQQAPCNKIAIFRSETNLGKTGAVRLGVDRCVNETILLVDADLKHFDENEIRDAISVYKTQQYDLVILRRINSTRMVKLIRADTLLSGERILSKTNLKKILANRNVQGYLLEVAINRYFMHKNAKRCFWSKNSAVNSYKYRKVNFFQGLYKDVRMYYRIFRFTGINNFYRQHRHFCKREISN